jgi:hypothetical protein
VDQESPFIGPRPFTEDDAKVFFGRKNELAALAAEVLSTQVVLLYAASGSGKSSLISAGLIPAVRDEGFRVSRARLNTLTPSDGQPPVDLLCEAIRKSAFGSSIEQPSLLVLDQFEEVVVAVTYAELHALSETVYSAMAKNPLARVLISFREEYLARIGALFNKATKVSVGRFHLDRLSRLGALEAFERSLGTMGVQVEREAGELFLEKLTPPTRRQRSEVGFEPLYLQLLGSQLWSSIANRYSAGTSEDTDGLNDGHPVIAVADVRGLVDFDQAIEIFYNTTISRVCRLHRVTEKVMRDWIDQKLVTPDETRSMVRRQVNKTEGIQTSVLDDLTNDGLLRTEPRGEDLWIELAHDQLVERVREFNRVWWTGRVYALLRDRAARRSIATAASRWDLQRWAQSRMMLWNLSTGIRESGMQLSQRYGHLLPFSRKYPAGELDRLGLRAFVFVGTLVNTAFYFYRFSTETDIPVTLPQYASTDIEGLDAETAKRRLQATALNLGRTNQLLAAANVVVAIGWVRLLSRVSTRFARSAIGAPPKERPRLRWWYMGVLCCADVALTQLRWAVRNGLIVNCLDPADETGRPRPLGRTDARVVRRCMRLEDAASWSRESPVLLVLDWRSEVDSTSEFERFVSWEVPLYESALRMRGAMAAWCCRGDVRRRGWRDAISGIGYPSRGQRIYYMIERGNVVAWRTVNSNEFPGQVRAATNGAESIALSAQNPAIPTEGQFKEILTALIVSSEAAKSPWREYRETFLRAGQGRRNRRGRRA